MTDKCVWYCYIFLMKFEEIVTKRLPKVGGGIDYKEA